MPALLVSAVCDIIRPLLNDNNSTPDYFTNTTIIPYIKIANEDLAAELQDNDVPVQKEQSAAITVTAGDDTPTLPDDFIDPIELFEKGVNDNDDKYIIMKQRRFTPIGVTTNIATLEYWDWRDQTVFVRPCNQDRVVMIRYWRLLAEITGDTSPLEVDKPSAKNYLAFHTASLMADKIGKNYTEADRLEVQARQRLDKYLNTQIKENQGNQVRRRPFRINTIRRGRAY